MTSEPRWIGDYGKEINRIAILLLETWKQVDPQSSVALNDCSYQATFADIAKAIVDDQNTRAVPDVPELVRYQPIAVTWDDGSPKTTEMVVIKEGEYVRYDQAAAVIAAKDAEIERVCAVNSKLNTDYNETINLLREKTAKLAQIEKPERDRYKQALEFYADTSKYPAPLTGGMGALWRDCGETARAALNPSEPRT